MSSHRCRGCQEYDRLTRRGFLGLGSGALAAAVVPAWLPRVVLAGEENSDRDVIVSIFLRGGADGLTLCPPHGDPAYYQLRPNLAIAPPDSGSPNRAIDLDGFFGLPPSMAPLLDAYEDGVLALIHACGLPNVTRSHFYAQHAMEIGMDFPPPSLFTGWLGRHLAATAPSVQDAVLRAVGIGAGLQQTLIGAPATLPVGDLATFGLGGVPETRDDRQQALTAMYAVASEPLASAGSRTVDTIELLDQIDFDSYQPAPDADYPGGELGNALRSTAALIKAEIGVEAVAVDVGGWDTHEFQGPINGQMAGNMGNLAATLAAFHKDLFSDGFDNVAVTAMSEFGRNAFENGSAGCDHGHGGLMLVLGGHVAGGRVVADWPGLGDGQLFENQDLAITIDYRDVLTELITKRLGNPDYLTVFGDDPDYVPVDRGLII